MRLEKRSVALIWRFDLLLQAALSKVRSSRGKASQTTQKTCASFANAIESILSEFNGQAMDRSKIVAVITGAIAILLSIAYLLIVQFLDFRGEMVPAPQDLSYSSGQHRDFLPIVAAVPTAATD